MSSRKESYKTHLAELREQTVALLELVSEKDTARIVHPDWSPLRWHLGHIAYIESLWVRRKILGRPSLNERYDVLFDPDKTPKGERKSLPTLAEIRTYAEQVRQETFEFIDRADFSSDSPLLRNGYICDFLLEHESQHQETMTLILQIFEPAAKKKGKGYSVRDTLNPQPSTLNKMVHVPAGTFPMGAGASDFSYDNEKPLHTVHVDTFWIDVVPVTNGLYERFIAEGGYRRKEFWTPEGWTWKEENKITAPRYWIRDGKENWLERTMFETKPFRKDAPVTGVSWYEAAAYARFTGKRLPTEAEWEKAAAWDARIKRARRFPWGDESPTRLHANFTRHFWGTTSVGAFPEGQSHYGCLDMAGNVWEWTASPFAPYPRFQWFPYQEYSVPFFDGEHYVLKGGSWATQYSLLRCSFRNWYRPEERAILAGFRCARSA